MACTDTFTLMKTSFKIKNPKLATAGSLQIHLKHRHVVLLQPRNDDTVTPATAFEVSFPVEISDLCVMKPHDLAFPQLRRRCILKALESVNIDESLRERLRPCIGKFVVEKTKAFGVTGFSVVAEIEVTKIE